MLSSYFIQLTILYNLYPVNYTLYPVNYILYRAACLNDPEIYAGKKCIDLFFITAVLLCICKNMQT